MNLVTLDSTAQILVLMVHMADAAWGNVPAKIMLNAIMLRVNVDAQVVGWGQIVLSPARLEHLVQTVQDR